MTVAFLEVLPRLAPGVVVQVHDVTLPWDYPTQQAELAYSEQYLLAAYLLGGPAFDILLPNFHVAVTPALHEILAPIWSPLIWSGAPINGLSFWMTRTAAGLRPG